VLKEFSLSEPQQLIVDNEGMELSQMHKDDTLFKDGKNLKTLYIFNTASKGT